MWFVQLVNLPLLLLCNTLSVTATSWRYGQPLSAAAASETVGKHAFQFAGVCTAEDDQQRFKEDILQPFLRVRVSGTEANKQVREHIKSHMTSLGWHVTEDDFVAATPRGPRRFSNVVAVLDPGSRSRLTLACHYDSKQFDDINFIGATDSAVSCAMLMNVATCLNDSLHTRQPDKLSRSVQLIFFDGEESIGDWTEDDSLYGSRHLADVMARSKFVVENEDSESDEDINNNHSTDSNDLETSRLLDAIEVLILLDLIGTRQTHFVNWFPQTSHIYSKLANIELALSADRQLLQPAADTATTSRFNRYFHSAHTVFTNGQSWQSIQDDHVPFMDKGVPAVHLISYPFPPVWHTKADNETAIDYNTVYDISAILRVFAADFLALID